MRESEPEQFITKALDTMLPLVEEVYGDDLLMIALYGSAATGAFVRNVSDINLLIIVTKADATQLCALAKKAKRCLQEFRITPQILSKQELLTSADIFPVEYLEIRQSMHLLYGTSLFDELDIGHRNIRHQVETMLRGGLNSLRQILLLTACESKILYRELLSWSGRQIPMYRAILRLYGDTTVIEDPKGLIKPLEEHLKCSCSSLEALMRLREVQPKDTDLMRLTAELLTQYMQIVEVIDAYESQQ
jgi:hypothetical protein